MSAGGQLSISAVGRKTAAGIRQDGAGAGGQVRHPLCGRAGNGLDSERRNGYVPSCRSCGADECMSADMRSRLAF